MWRVPRFKEKEVNVILDEAMIIGLLRMWAKRNLASEGLEIETFRFEQGKLFIKLRESEEKEEE